MCNDVAAPLVEETSIFVAELGKTVDDCTLNPVGCAPAGFNSLKRYAVFDPVSSSFKAEVAVTFSGTLTSRLWYVPAIRSSYFDYPIGYLNIDIQPNLYNNKSPLLPVGRNKAPP